MLRSIAIRVLVAAVFLLSAASLRAEVKVLRVDPQVTDASIETVHGPHIALYDPQVKSNHLLFVYLPGTKAKAEYSETVDSSFAKWGYRAVSLDYENNVLAVSCGHSADSACFDHYRETIVTGAPGSDKMTVSPTNSILNRLQKLLTYLAKQNPDGGWGEFIVNGQPTWSKIVLAGHSQGSGHAAFLAKKFAVERVLMFSGPQDYMDDAEKPAPWESMASATSPSRFFAFLNANDPFNVKHQIASCAVLMSVAKPSSLTIKAGEPVEGTYQILINEEVKKAHESTLSLEFENAWKYLATQAVR